MNTRGAASRAIIAMQQRTERRAIEARLPQAAPEASIENQPFDLSSYMHEVNELDVDVDRTGSETAALESLDVTKQHHYRQTKLEEDFIAGVGNVETSTGKKKWEKVLELVPNPNPTVGRRAMSKEVPRCFVELSGQITNDKINLLNGMLVDWQMRHKKCKVKDGECPWFQPGTQNLNIRAFLAHMAKNYNWNYTKRDFENSEGSLNAVMTSIYNDRLEKWVRIFLHHNSVHF